MISRRESKRRSSGIKRICRNKTNGDDFSMTIEAVVCVYFYKIDKIYKDLLSCVEDYLKINSTFYSCLEEVK